MLTFTYLLTCTPYILTTDNKFGIIPANLDIEIIGYVYSDEFNFI